MPGFEGPSVPGFGERYQPSTCGTAASKGNVETTLNTFETDVPAPQTDNGRIKKRSVLIDGHQTSVSLENAFWDALKSIAQRRGLSLNQMIAGIDRQRTGNLSSAIRVFVLTNMERDRT